MNSTDLPSMASRLSLPVTVLLERREVSNGRWSTHTWVLDGVVHGARSGETALRATPIRDTEKGAVLAWSGYHITLYKDACERYWHALIGDEPKVYVVCREDDDADANQLPLLVTIDYDVALAHAETDDTVLSGTIPGDLYRYMEAFVLSHYQPKPFVKRKRKRWVDGESGQHGQ